MSNSYVPGVTFPMPGSFARPSGPRGANGPALLLGALFWAGAVFSFVEGARQYQPAFFWLGGLLTVLGILSPMGLKMANQWERAVVLRLGKLQSVQGPGLFLIIPVIDDVAAWLDQRIQTTEFNAEQALS